MCKSCGCGGPEGKKEIYECEDCGRTSEKQKECCGKLMKKKE